MPLALPADAWEIKATQPPRGQGSSALDPFFERSLDGGIGYDVVRPSACSCVKLWQIFVVV